MFKEFAVFFKTGKTTTDKNYFQDFLILFSIVFTIGILIGLLKGYIYDINLIDNEDFEMLNWETFISYVFIVPLIEEFVFRSSLSIPKANIYSVLFSIGLIIFSSIYIENETSKAISIVLIIIVQILYFKSNNLKLIINNCIEKNYLLLIYLTSISFGLIHIFNYDALNFQTFLSVIGRVIAGFYFAFIVTKYDLKSSYMLHGINNIIPFLILLVAK